MGDRRGAGHPQQQTIVGSNTNTAKPTGIDCYFPDDGAPKAFNIQVDGGACAKPIYQATYIQHTGYAADTTLMCVWPFGCVCHAVRAPGVKWTLLALSREPSEGAATASM